MPSSILRPRFTVGASALAAAAVLSLPDLSQARPPANPDPALAPWFESLQQPDSGVSCCSIADCRPTEFRTVGDHFEALIEEKWLPVPPEKVLQRTDNPVGRAVVCWTPDRGIMCFVRGTET